MIAGIISGLGGWRVLALLAALAGLLWALDTVTADRDAAQLEAALAAEAARRNAAAVDAVQRQADRSLAAMAAAHAAERARATRAAAIERVISDAPPTSACADSPAIRAVLDGLRPPLPVPAGAGAGAAAPAGGAAGLPASPGPARAGGG